jgi:hypothetical protein
MLAIHPGGNMKKRYGMAAVLVLAAGAAFGSLCTE